MDEMTRTNLANLHSAERNLQNQAFFALIETESDPKYRKKYAGVWRVKPK